MTALHQNTVSHLRSSITNDAAANEVQTLLERINGGGDGAVPTALADYVTVVEHGDGALHRTELTITALPIAVVDAGANGAHGTAKLYDFPEGQIKILGGHMNLTSLLAGAGGIIDAGVLDIGVGSATTSVANETLASTEQDIIAKKDVTLSGGAAANQASITSADVTLNGSSTPIDANLNVAVEATSASADDTLTVSGLVTLHWLNLGDG